MSRGLGDVYKRQYTNFATMKVDLIKNDKLVIIPFWILIFFIFWLQVLPQVKSIWESILFSVLLVLTICPIANYLSGSLLLKAMKQKGVKLFMFQFSFFSLLIGFAFLAYINLFFWLENSGVFPSGSEYFDVTDLAPYAFFIPLSSGIITVSYTHLTLPTICSV